MQRRTLVGRLVVPCEGVPASSPEELMVPHVLLEDGETVPIQLTEQFLDFCVRNRVYMISRRYRIFHHVELVAEVPGRALLSTPVSMRVRLSRAVDEWPEEWLDVPSEVLGIQAVAR